MIKLWQSRELQPASDNITERLLAVRGFANPQDKDAFFNLKLSDLKSPLCLKGMDKAVERLGRAFKTQEPLCVYGDFDLDGTSGLALLYEGLTQMGYSNVLTYQPLRLKEGYGFHAWAVDDLAAQGVKVIVTVDVGITAFAAINRARELGIDVIVTDHHLPSQGLPEAYCIINPNQGGCPSDLGYLSGAGVGFYLIRGLMRYLMDQGLAEPKPQLLQNLLEFVVIATITDMVPMRGDNRPLVRAGLKQLSQTQRAGLRAMLEMTNLLGRNLSAQDVAIRLAPKLNALSRMELGLKPVDILLESDPARAKELMQKVSEQNGMRVQLQQEGERLAQLKLESQAEHDFIFVFDPSFHRGVIGLIATKIAKDFGKPTYIGSLDEEGRITGSARLPDSYPVGLTEALSSASKVLSRFGGHFAAAGFELERSHIPEFEKSLSEFYQKAKNQDFKRVIEYDFDLEPTQVSLETIDQLRSLEPFGQGFEAPVFGLRKLVTTQVKELKGGHLKVFFSPVHGPNQKIEGLGFGLQQDLADLLRSSKPKDLLVEIQRNDFNGNSTAQVRIVDAKESELV